MSDMDLSSHSEKQILEGCISLMQEMVDGFREYLDYIGHDEPEYEEEKQPFHMSYILMDFCSWLDDALVVIEAEGEE